MSILDLAILNPIELFLKKQRTFLKFSSSAICAPQEKRRTYGGFRSMQVAGIGRENQWYARDGHFYVATRAWRASIYMRTTATEVQHGGHGRIAPTLPDHIDRENTTTPHSLGREQVSQFHSHFHFGRELHILLNFVSTYPKNWIGSAIFVNIIST